MRFFKYHGLGNDFVMLVDRESRMGPRGALASGLVRDLCDRHTGVGADGVIRVLGPQDGTALGMDYYNADGGSSPMCGNGIRCVAVLARREGLIAPGEHRVMTGAGPVTVRLGEGANVTVDMGAPKLDRAGIPMTGDGSALDAALELPDGTTVAGTGVSMGNPHFVIFGRGLSDDNVLGLGPAIENHAAFPERTNVEFAEVESPGELRMRVWERGVGETLACGSGACAVLVAAAATGRSERTATVRLPGGALQIQWEEDDHVWMTGPAEEVFAGELSPSWVDARTART